MPLPRAAHCTMTDNNRDSMLRQDLATSLNTSNDSEAKSPAISPLTMITIMRNGRVIGHNRAGNRGRQEHNRVHCGRERDFLAHFREGTDVAAKPEIIDKISASILGLFECFFC